MEALRKLVELNMDKKHYENYIHSIEPTIKSMLDNYLKGWQGIETTITRMTMRSKGAYKNTVDFLLLEGDDPNEFADDIEISTYKKVDDLWFSNKIQYLHEKSILGDSIYALLCFANNRRNKIHGYEDAFIEIDRLGFSVTSELVNWLHILNLSHVSLGEKLQVEMLKNCEIRASQLLKEWKEKLQTSKLNTTNL